VNAEQSKNATTDRVFMVRAIIYQRALLGKASGQLPLLARRGGAKRRGGG